jgi:hypothetical protein
LTIAALREYHFAVLLNNQCKGIVEGPMAELTANVNWLAVIVGAIVAYGFGWVWYGAIFGKRWSQGLGISVPEKLPVVAMAVQALGTFLLAWLFGITAGHDALATIILIVVTIMVLMAAGGMYAQKKGDVIAIEVGYVAVMAVILFLAQGLL